MQRSAIGLAFLLILFGILLLVYNAKDAYEVLPVQEPVQLEDEINDGWKEYQDDQGDFKAQFPTEPQHAVENIRSADTDELRLYKIFASETPEGKVYMVSIVTFSKDAYKMGNNALMHRFVNELVSSNQENVMEKIEPAAYKDHPGYDFTITNPRTTMEGTVFMDGQRLVLLSHMRPKSVQSGDFGRFKDTFELSK
jgi:hypothetical protein